MLHCQITMKRLRITVPKKLHICTKCSSPQHANEQFRVPKQVTWPGDLVKLMYIPKYQFTYQYLLRIIGILLGYFCFRTACSSIFLRAYYENKVKFGLLYFKTDCMKR